MNSADKHVDQQRGITGLETAIILMLICMETEF